MKKILTILASSIIILSGLVINQKQPDQIKTNAAEITENYLFVIIRHEVTTNERQIWLDQINPYLGFTNNEINLKMFADIPITNQTGEMWDRTIWYKNQVSDKFTPENINNIQTLIGTNLIRIIPTSNMPQTQKDLYLYDIAYTNVYPSNNVIISQEQV